MKNIIVVVGATGSGKDTVADLLCKQYHCNKYGISSVLKKLLHQQ